MGRLGTWGKHGGHGPARPWAPGSGHGEDAAGERTASSARRGGGHAGGGTPVRRGPGCGKGGCGWAPALRGRRARAVAVDGGLAPGRWQVLRAVVPPGAPSVAATFRLGVPAGPRGKPARSAGLGGGTLPPPLPEMLWRRPRAARRSSRLCRRMWRERFLKASCGFGGRKGGCGGAGNLCSPGRNCPAVPVSPSLGSSGEGGGGGGARLTLQTWPTCFSSQSS